MLGGSAGSLPAFEQFFRNLPNRCGLAIVVVMHLPAGQPSLLAEILQEFTEMAVLTAEDGLKLRMEHVYVVPAGYDTRLLHGTLLLTPAAQPASRRLPIDGFLQSLAKDARERAVAIICSGLGSDGAIGVKLIMESFGMVMVQEPATAEYDAMPYAAITTGFADYILPPAEMPAQLLAYVALPLAERVTRPATDEAAPTGHALQKICGLIRAQTGHDFSHYKRNTMMRRIERRMHAHQITLIDNYVRYLHQNPPEVQQLFKELLIGVTKFFRDTDAFQALRARLLPLLQDKPTDSMVRVWAPGCSTGEEAYSLAILLLECFSDTLADRHLQLQIFATDINSSGIDVARTGLYPVNIEADVTPERLSRFFMKVEGGYLIRKEVRDSVIFALHDINKDAPFTRLDLLCCRNLLIYLSAELQKNLLPVFHYALKPGALLFLGPSENLPGLHDLFTPLDIKWKIARRAEVPPTMARLVNFPFSMTPQVAVPSHFSTTMLPPSPRRESGPFADLVQRVLLRSYAPPAVVINEKGEILYVNGRTGKYLEPAPGLSGLNLFEMAREELNFELSSAVHKALQQREDVKLERIRVRTDSGFQFLTLTVKYLEEPEALSGLLLVVFEDQPTPRRIRSGQQQPINDLTRDAVVATLDKELRHTKHRLQTTIEEMESSLEELKSTNEELQSANEELQSTNEEAMTNKEELQSLNEELMTLNMQYLHKTEELSESANDIKNLLDATEIATIFLDNDLVIKRFTPHVTRIINLLPSDVGRPITHFSSNLRHASLAQDIQQVLDRLVSTEINIQTTYGDWYAMRILPYRTLDNFISGAVITFTEITSLKRLEEQLKEKARFLETMRAAVREAIIVFDTDRRVYYFNHAFAELLGTPDTDLTGLSLAELGGGVLNQSAVHNLLGQLFLISGPDEPNDVDHLSLNLQRADGTSQSLIVYGRALRHEGQSTDRVLIGVSAVEG
jgi:two-component system, chemotaxis family, CheB/CheR fusion protein